MEWIILHFALIVFFMAPDILCQNCVPEVNRSSFTVKEGKPLVVECFFKNCQNNFQRTQWWRNETRIYSMDYTKRIYETHYLRVSKLVINPVKLEDSGTFTCINDIDYTKNVSIKLNVGEPHSSTVTPSSASHFLRSWTSSVLCFIILCILSKN